MSLQAPGLDDVGQAVGNGVLKPKQVRELAAAPEIPLLLVGLDQRERVVAGDEQIAADVPAFDQNVRLDVLDGGVVFPLVIQMRCSSMPLSLNNLSSPRKISIMPVWLIVAILCTFFSPASCARS